MASDKKIYSIEIDGVQKFDASIEKISGGFDTTAGSVVNLKKELRNTIAELVGLDENSDRFKQLSVRAGELKDQIGDVNERVKNLASDTQKLDGFIGIASGITSGFALAQGTLGLFGAENKKLEQTLLKVQSSIAVLNGLQGIQNVLQKQSAANLLITNALQQSSTAQRLLANVQLGIQNGLQSTNIVVTTAAAAAQRVLNAAMAANPIGVVLVLLGSLIAAYELFINTEEEATEVTNENTAALKNQSKEIDILTVSIDDLIKKREEDILQRSKAFLDAYQLDVTQAKIDAERVKRSGDLIAAKRAELKIENEVLDVARENLRQVLLLMGNTTEQQRDAEQNLRVKNAELEVEKQLTIIYEKRIELAALTKRNLNEEVQLIKSLTVATIEYEKEQRKVLKTVEVEGEKAADILNRDAEAIIARRQATIQFIQDTTQVASQLAVQLSIIASQNLVSLYQQQIEALSGNEKQLQEQLNALQNKTNEIEENIANNRGRRRERFINDLRLQQKAEKEIADKQAKIAKDKAELEKKIKREQLEQQKLEIQISTAQIGVTSALAIAAQALSSAKQDVTFGIATAASIVAVSAAIGTAVAKTRQINAQLEGFADGGFTGKLDRTGHRQAGIVHDDEYVVPKRVVNSQRGRVLINKLETLRGNSFADGGFTPANFDGTGGGTDFNEVIKAMQDIQIFVAVNDINAGQERLNKIKQATVI